MRNRPLVALAAAGLLAATGACSAQSAAADGLTVVAGFYPLEFLADRVGGAHVNVTALAPPGADAHDLELVPSQVAAVSDADLVVYLAGFQPAVDDTVDAYAENAVDVAVQVPLLPATGEDHDHDHDHGGDHGDADPHLWLDPQRMTTLAGVLADELARLDPDHAGAFRANAAALGADLSALDTAYAGGLATCERREIIVSHAAFGYLADQYQLEQIAITGLSPEDEPTPQRLQEVIAAAREHGATTVYFEVLVSPAVAETIADAAGADTAVLDPVEGLAPDTDNDYLSLMRANLEALRQGLGCQ